MKEKSVVFSKDTSYDKYGSPGEQCLQEVTVLYKRQFLVPTSPRPVYDRPRRYRISLNNFANSNSSSGAQDGTNLPPHTLLRDQ